MGSGHSRHLISRIECRLSFLAINHIQAEMQGVECWARHQRSSGVRFDQPRQAQTKTSSEQSAEDADRGSQEQVQVGNWIAAQ